MSYRVSDRMDPFEIIKNAIYMFEAEDVNKDETLNVDTAEQPQPTNIEIAPPEEQTSKNSDFFANGKIKNSVIGNDPAVQNLIKIMTANMQDETTIRPYIDDFFTRLGINDVDPEQFKTMSGEIWEKLEQLTDLDTKTSLAEFQTWIGDKVGKYNS